MKAFTDLEVWDKPIFEYGMKPKDPKNPDGPKEHAVIGVKGFTKQYSMPFNKEDLKSLYDMRPGKESSSVSLILLRIGYDDIPKIIHILSKTRITLQAELLMGYGITCQLQNTNSIGVLETV